MGLTRTVFKELSIAGDEGDEGATDIVRTRMQHVRKIKHWEISGTSVKYGVTVRSGVIILEKGGWRS